MGLLSFLKRKSGDAAKASAPPVESADTVQQARTRARQRLIGAAVLVAAGVIGFPLLFETQPRPLPVDIPIEIARKDGAATAPPTHGSTAAKPMNPVPPSVISEPVTDPGRDAAASAPSPSITAPASAPMAVAATAPPPAPAPKLPVVAEPAHAPAPPLAPKPVDGIRAQALLEGKEAAGKKVAAEGRFIVQVGAFSEVAAAREVRHKVEKLGLKTYTQVVETSGGNRIRVRVGPFASRDEADKAAGKIKSAGLPSAVYTL